MCTCGVRCGLWWRGGPPQKNLGTSFWWGGWKANKKKKKTPPTFQKRNAPVALGNVALLFCFCIIKVCVCVCGSSSSSFSSLQHVFVLFHFLLHRKMCVGCESQRRHWRRDNRPNCLSLNKSGHGAKLFQAKEIKNYLISTLHL